jgi:hypothetical protein
MTYYETSFSFLFYFYFITHPSHTNTRHVKFTIHYRHFIWLEGHSHTLQCDNSPAVFTSDRVNFADEDLQRIQTDDKGNVTVLEPVKLDITGMFSGQVLKCVQVNSENGVSKMQSEARENLQWRYRQNS